MNLDSIWSREPGTIKANLGYLSNLITTCQSSGFDPELPRLGPCSLDDVMGYGVAFSMLVHSRRPGRHSANYCQYATIRKQRSAFSNLYNASPEAAANGQVISMGSETNA